jgi:hypothetical protein
MRACARHATARMPTREGGNQKFFGAFFQKSTHLLSSLKSQFLCCDAAEFMRHLPRSYHIREIQLKDFPP